MYIIIILKDIFYEYILSSSLSPSQYTIEEALNSTLISYTHYTSRAHTQQSNMKKKLAYTIGRDIGIYFYNTQDWLYCLVQSLILEALRFAYIEFRIFSLVDF